MHFNSCEDVIDTVAKLCVLFVLLCFLIICTLFLTDNLDKTMAYLRQLSLLLAVSMALAEYATCLVNSLLLKDPLMILSGGAVILLMIAPCVTLILSLVVCDIPDVILGDTCVAFEQAHLFTLVTVISAIWYHIIAVNAECTDTGGCACPSRVPIGTLPVYNNEISQNTRPSWWLTWYKGTEKPPVAHSGNIL